MLRLQCQTAMAYFNIQCAQCRNFVRVTYVGYEQAIPTIEAICDTCNVAERFKLGNRWQGLPPATPRPDTGTPRQRPWVTRGADRRSGRDRRRPGPTSTTA